MTTKQPFCRHFGLIVIVGIVFFYSDPGHFEPPKYNKWPLWDQDFWVKIFVGHGNCNLQDLYFICIERVKAKNTCIVWVSYIACPTYNRVQFLGILLITLKAHTKGEQYIDKRNIYIYICLYCF